jgi:hypothetical protein
MSPVESPVESSTAARIAVRFAAPIATLLLALTLSACGGDDKGTNGDGGGGSGPISARIDGKAWASGEAMAKCRALSSPGGLSIEGAQATDDAATALVFNLYNIQGPGTYPLGVGTNAIGGILAMSETDTKGGAKTWISPMNGLSGSITFTKVGAAGVAGTFTCTLKPSPGNSGDAIEITDGKFDLPLTGTLAPVPDNAGNRVIAKLNGEPFHAVAVTSLTAAQFQGPGLQFAAMDDERTISVMFMGVEGAGTYSLKDADPVRIMSVVFSKAGSVVSWGPDGTRQDSGTVVVTSLTATRVKGTFSATLGPQAGSAATEPMVITDGEFDIGIP